MSKRTTTIRLSPRAEQQLKQLTYTLEVSRSEVVARALEDMAEDIVPKGFTTSRPTWVDRPRKAERLVRRELERLAVEYVAEKRFDRYRVDFFIPDKNLVIECDGEEHALTWNAEYDQKRDAYLVSLGLKIVRIPNSRIYEDVRTVIAEALK